MRPMIPLLLTLLVLPLPAVAAPPPRAVAAGHSLATPTGIRLFPRLVGEPMPGWLQATGGVEMASAYEGYHEEAALSGGARLVTVRSHGLLAAYVIEHGRCTGELLVEPTVPDPLDATARALRRSGFTSRPGLVTTRDHSYGANAVVFERRRGPATEQYLLVDLATREDGVVNVHTYVGAEGYWPTRLQGALAPAIAQGTAALAECCRELEQRARASGDPTPF